MNTQLDRFSHTQAISTSCEQDYWQVGLRKHTWRSNDLYEIPTTHQWHVPIHDRDVRIGSAKDVERCNTVCGLNQLIIGPF